MDETACKRGHNYVSVFVDMAALRVLFASEDRDAKTLARFLEDFEAHGGALERVVEVRFDISKAFVSGVERNFLQAHVTVYRFQIMNVVNEAVDEVRREEA